VAVLTVVLTFALAGCSAASGTAPAGRAALVPAAPPADGIVGPGTLPPKGVPSAQDPPLTAQPPVPVPVRVPAQRAGQVVSRIPTRQRVVFLGVDDGYLRSHWLLVLEQQRHLPYTAFLTNAAWRQDPGYWRQLQAAGVRIEDHTLTHPQLTGLRAGVIYRQICVVAAQDATTFGHQPLLFRPPYGANNALVRREAARCGMRAVVQWDVTVNHGALQYTGGRQHLQPGDIVLMHFRPEIQQDMTAFLRQAAADGLAVGSLEDYLTPRV